MLFLSLLFAPTMVVLLIVSLPRWVLAAGNQKIIMEAVPDTIEVCGNGAGNVELLLHNVTDKTTFSNLQFSFADTSGAKAIQSDAGGTPLTLAPGRTRITKWTVKSPERDGQLFFRLYEGNPANSQLVGATKLDIKLRRAQAISEVARVETRISTDSIDEQDKARVILTVVNLLGRMLTVSVESPLPAANADCADAGPSNQILDANETATFSFEVMGKKAGVDVVGLRTNLEWNDGWCARKGTLFNTQQIRTTAPASDVLTAFGVPSLLLLPGFVFLATWPLLWSFGWTISGRKKLPMAAKSPEFWLLAFFISCPSLLASGLLGATYPNSFRMMDIVKVCLCFLGLSVFTYGVWSLVACIVTKRKKAAQVAKTQAATNERRARMVVEGDTVSAVLTKLKLQEAGTLLVSAKLRETGQPEASVFVLPQESDTDKRWVIPPISLEQSQDDELQKKIDDCRNNNGSVADLVELIGDPSRVRVTWAPGARLTGPHLALLVNLEMGQKASFVQVS